MPSRTTGIINGTDFTLYNSTTKIGNATSCAVQVARDMRDTSNKDSSGWKAVLPGQGNWSVSVEGLISLDGTTNYIYLLNLLINKTAVTAIFKTANSADYYLTGSGYVTSVSATSPNEANATFSVNIQGTGALTVVDGSTP